MRESDFVLVMHMDCIMKVKLEHIQDVSLCCQLLGRLRKMEKIQLVLVDDELSSRNTIKKYLEENDIYEIIADFKNGKTALDWLRKNSVDILLCDMQMPEMNGVELMRNVHIINEYLPVIELVDLMILIL